ncbi:unnamed protein product [Spirodela intermedia]|uniref:peptidylprolyl isomerase n=1 Tax=Spirodela intermedia TaxID=51605 RepID=A0A7I8JU62_SPIIN|nr:unnamed protein product [Spirodela intermedia]CAA6673619.1 unnamed protein product [Spirodela intermedia]
MSFWGVEVKPGKPYTHIHDNSRGPLRLSQVTLGDGAATKRSVLQCNVGDKSPVLLCSLLPDKAECCGMDLQFEECYEVIFSVVGPRSVHLAGYYVDVGSRRGTGVGNDSDSFGEDVGETGSEESGSHGSEDRYESDFIDDGDVEMSPSHQRANGFINDETIKCEKTTNGSATRQRLRRKHRISDSDEGEDDSQHQIISNPGKSPVLEGEDDDFFPISFSVGQKNEERNVGGDRKLDSIKFDVNVDRKNDATLQDKVPEGEHKIEVVKSEKSKKKKKDKAKLLKSPETDVHMPDEVIQDRPSEDPSEDGKRDEAHTREQEKEELNQEGCLDENSGKPKKRKKTRDRKGESPEKGLNSSADKVDEGKNGKSELAVDHAVEPVLAENSGKSKKKKKGKGRGGDTHERNADLSEEKIVRATNAEEPNSGRHCEQADDHNNINDLTVGRDNEGNLWGEETRPLEELRKDGDDPSRSTQAVEHHEPPGELPLDIGSNSGEEPAPDADPEPNKRKSRRKKGSH